MCEALPGCRCARETRGPAVIALDDYRDRHPAGPAVDPLTAARHNGARVMRLPSTWASHEAVLNASADEASSLMNVVNDLAETRRGTWGTTIDPALAARLERDEGRANRDYDATIIGMATLQCSVDATRQRITDLSGNRTDPAAGAAVTRERARLAAQEARLDTARTAAATALSMVTVPASDAPAPVSGGHTLHDPRWQGIGVIAQPRTAGDGTRTYRVCLIDVAERREMGRFDLPAHQVELNGCPDKGRVAASLAPGSPAGNTFTAPRLRGAPQRLTAE